MLDEAERAGRNAPTTAERFSVVAHGLGVRLDRRFAIVAAILALLTAAAGAASVWALPTVTGAAWVLPALTVFLGPTLVVAAGIALVRERGLVTEPRAILALILSVLALAAAALTQLSWALGFDAADRGMPITGLAAAWPWLFITAWAVGAAAIVTLVNAALRRTRVRPSAGIIISVVAGTLLAPPIGMSLISPYTVAAAAVAMALAIIVSKRAPVQARESSNRSESLGANEIPARTRAVARTSAAISAVVSAIGVAYALTGSQWGGTRDQTEAMGQGITLALLAALPLLAAIGVSVVARGRTRPLHTWGPLLLSSLALGGVAVAYRGSPAWDSMAPGFAVSSVLGGVAIAWWTAPRLPGAVRLRVTIALLIGVVYAAFLGILITPMLAFCLPLIAAAFVIWTPGKPSHGPRSNVVDALSSSGNPLPTPS
ncbi:hypothetical protein SAMN05216554_4585 [Herbiconiux ginsengi]|uniref:Uncharacterized protein n=2 Tax=Herbiconiux ginsengi TaxID=381665 RepID=A0A1H3TYH2_9MICO|nr:hypothetical protein SAMN05216554_4585 [Herbiconiux ginsengi]